MNIAVFGATGRTGPHVLDQGIRLDTAEQ